MKVQDLVFRNVHSSKCTTLESYKMEGFSTRVGTEAIQSNSKSVLDKSLKAGMKESASLEKVRELQLHVDLNLHMARKVLGPS